MATTEELFNHIDTHINAFKENHEAAKGGNKAAATRARKAIGEIKKMATDYRKASVAENK